MERIADTDKLRQAQRVLEDIVHAVAYRTDQQSRHDTLVYIRSRAEDVLDFLETH